MNVVYCSEIGSILGVNKYKSRMAMFQTYNTRKRLHTKSEKHPLFQSNTAQREIEQETIEKLSIHSRITCYPPQKLEIDYNNFVLKGCCDGITSDGCLVEVKRREKYIHEHISWRDYAQIQGYLQLYDVNNCYYVQQMQNDIKIEKIRRDDVYWSNYVIPELTAFFKLLDHGLCQS